jgi:hypothetical protein
MSKSSLPNYFTSKIIHPENLIQNIHPDIGVGVPIAMQEYTPRGLEDAVHLRNPLFQPRNIMVNAACPAILKTADFPRVSPDKLVIPVAEKRRVQVDKVNAFRFQRFEDFKVIAKDEALDAHVIPNLQDCFSVLANTFM